MALRAKINDNTVIVGDLNTTLPPIDRSSRQKNNKETSELLHTLDQIDKVDIYRVFHPITRQCTFFSAAHQTFSKIDHILGLKESLNKFKKIKITPCIISDPSGIKLDLNNKRNPRKNSNTWRLNNILLKKQWVTKVIREEIFEKINKINKPLDHMTKWRREKTQINKIRDEKGDIKTNITKSRQSLEYLENLYSNKLENLDEMDKFLDAYIQPKLNQEDINHLNSPIKCSEIKAKNKESPYKEEPRT
jgi:hypothetical protein